jgi:2-oxoglutarate ferredoxin oxidoreductase subunit alpha
MKNIATPACWSALLDIGHGGHRGTAGRRKYGRKKALRSRNHKAVRLGYGASAMDNLSCPLPMRLLKMIRGTASLPADKKPDRRQHRPSALGCLYAGATVAAWYTDHAGHLGDDAFKGLCDKYLKDPETGKKNYCILAGRGRAGCHRNGDRRQLERGPAPSPPPPAPGISLMNELIGLAYYRRDPRAVVIDVSAPPVPPPHADPHPAGGHPGLRLRQPRRHQAHPAVPVEPQRVLPHGQGRFDLAERFQTPVIMLSDLDIGMNDWVTPRLTWDDSYRPTGARC